MRSGIVTKIIACCKLSRSRRFTLILFFGNSAITIFLYLRFYFNNTYAHICNQNDSDIIPFHSTASRDDCSGQIDDGHNWQYRNGIDGTWHCWSNASPGRASSQTSAYLLKICHCFWSLLFDYQEWNLNWLNQKPVDYLGVIVYLARRSELDKLNMSLLSLRQYLRNPRPIVIFHEGDLNDVTTQSALARTLGSQTPLGFEHIRLPYRVRAYLLNRQNNVQ